MISYHQLLNDIITSATEQIEQIDHEDFNFKQNPSKWSKKELLGHLIDSAYNNHQRFLRAKSQPNLVFQGYDQDDWVVQNNYQNRAKENVLETWAIVNRHLSDLIKGIPAQLLNRQTREHNFHKICMNRLEEKQTSTLSYLIWDYLFHLEHHLGQIIPNYEKMTNTFAE